MTAIQFDQVSLQFPHAPHPAVDRCSFTVSSGELVVILGPSGCGKTTLLKMVNRLYEPTQGRIYLDGQDSQRLPATTLRRQIGYVIQQSGLFPHMTVAQNVAVVPQLLGWSKTRIQQRIEELLTLVELPPKDYRNRYPAQLSGGQQQRVGLARALAGDPKLLLMDEPFGAIDAITRTTLQTEVLRLQRQVRKTILFVSHDVEEALRLADRILVMHQGQIVQFASPLQILTYPANTFVQTLLGTTDRLRQLGVLRVAPVMTAPSESLMAGYPLPQVAPEASLRDALSLMLATGATQVAVQANGQPIGLVTLDQIRLAAQARQTATLEDSAISEYQ